MFYFDHFILVQINKLLILCIIKYRLIEEKSWTCYTIITKSKKQIKYINSSEFWLDFTANVWPNELFIKKKDPEAVWNVFGNAYIQHRKKEKSQAIRMDWWVVVLLTLWCIETREKIGCLIKQPQPKIYLENDKVKDSVNIFVAWNQNSTSILTINFYMCALRFTSHSIVCHFFVGHQFRNLVIFRRKINTFVYNVYICFTLFVRMCVLQWIYSVSICVMSGNFGYFNRATPFLFGNSPEHFYKVFDIDKRHMWHKFSLVFLLVWLTIYQIRFHANKVEDGKSTLQINWR